MHDTTDASAIFAPLWKRKWMILIVGLVAAVGSYFYYKHQPSVYSVSTQLNLASGSEEQSVAGTRSANFAKDALGNATAIITSGIVAEEAHRLLRAKHQNAKGKVTAKASATGSDLVAITVEARTARGAARLANAYAQAYINRTHASYTRVLQNQITSARGQLHRLELAAASSGKGKGGTNATDVIQAASLATKLNQLESQLSVQTVQQVSTAKPKNAQLLEPKPKSNAIFGFAFGLVIAAIAAFLLERLDRSLRSLGAVEAAFGSRLLAALPTARNPIVAQGGSRRPSRVLVDPMRLLATRLSLREANGSDAPPRTLLVTSANAGDGKSTLVAALALVKREAGERVAVVEADFRHPTLGPLLGLAAQPGLADVLGGHRSLDEALAIVPSAPDATPASPVTNGEGAATATLLQTGTLGSVSVLLGGTAAGGPPPGFHEQAFAHLIATMAGEYDTVLIDAPSPLEAGETLPLLGCVDGIVVVARLRHTQEASAARLTEMLQADLHGPVLGVVANDVPARELQRSGFAAAPARRVARSPKRR